MLPSNEAGLPRRTFLRRFSAAAALAVGGLPAAAAPASAGSVRLGGPVFKPPGDPEELAAAHRALGYRAAYCPKIALDDGDRIRAVERAFARADVVIAEVGRWCNLLEADAAKRAANLKLVTEGLALADAVGARCCVNIAGSYHPKVWFGPHPRNFSADFFDAAVQNARAIIDAVKPRRAKFAYEMMGWALPDSAAGYKRLIESIDRPGFGVHLDPANAINSPARFYDTTALLNECFDLLGKWIVSCHAKDVAWSDPVEMQVHLLEVVPGKGVLDYKTYLRRLAALPDSPPLMLEHLKSAEEYQAAARHIRARGEQAGVSIAR